MLLRANVSENYFKTHYENPRFVRMLATPYIKSYLEGKDI